MAVCIAPRQLLTVTCRHGIPTKSKLSPDIG
jgi:hypothetical protein